MTVMHTENARLTDQLQREFDGDPWHGPSLRAILEGITAEQAARRYAAHAHTIWELVLHITGWKREVADRLKGKLAGDPEAGDWPPTGEVSEPRWRAAKTDLARAHEELVAAVEALPLARLHEPVRDERNPPLGTGMTAWQTISGLIQHDVYHAGQIAMLKKMTA